MRKLTLSNLLLLSGVSLLLSLPAPILAQRPAAESPASTYKPGYWQPAARVNPNRPVKITLINKTRLPVVYNSLDGRADQRIAPGASAKINSVSLPANIAIYDPSAPTAMTTILNYVPKVLPNNTLEIQIQPDTTSTGYRVINIDTTGGIYFY